VAGGTPSSEAAGSGGAPLAEGQLHLGVLALQGAFREHVRMLRKLGAKVTEVRLPRDLEGLDGLMIPGGESTTIGLLLGEYKLMDPLREFVTTHPVFGTCAGLIMLAKHTTDGEQPLLQVMDITVRRNAFGRQPRSFEGLVELTLDRAPGAAPAEFHGIFIRAPWVEETGPGVEVIARHGEHIVGVRQGQMMGVAFHPELSDDARLHEYFLEMVRAKRVRPSKVESS
jgi:5'-phosphate synthase pdxT subunit